MVAVLLSLGFLVVWLYQNEYITQLRAGVQHDLEDTIDTTFSAGLGLSPFDVVHIDIAGSTSGSDSYGAVLQLSFTF